MEGSGALGAVSIGLSESLLILIVVVLAVFALWKVAKLIWAAFLG